MLHVIFTLSQPDRAHVYKTAGVTDTFIVGYSWTLGDVLINVHESI